MKRTLLLHLDLPAIVGNLYRLEISSNIMGARELRGKLEGVDLTTNSATFSEIVLLASGERFSKRRMVLASTKIPIAVRLDNIVSAVDLTKCPGALELTSPSADELESFRGNSAEYDISAPAEINPAKFFSPGEAYFIRTATVSVHGTVVGEDAAAVYLNDAAWIVDTGRYSNFIKGEAEPTEVEPYPRTAVVRVSKQIMVEAVLRPGKFIKQK